MIRIGTEYNDQIFFQDKNKSREKMFSRNHKWKKIEFLW